MSTEPRDLRVGSDLEAARSMTNRILEDIQIEYRLQTMTPDEAVIALLNAAMTTALINNIELNDVDHAWLTLRRVVNEFRRGREMVPPGEDGDPDDLPAIPIADITPKEGG